MEQSFSPVQSNLEPDHAEYAACTRLGAHSPEAMEASRLASENGAAVRHVLYLGAAFEELCAGRGADLLLVGVNEDVGRLIDCLAAERLFLPVVAYDIATDAPTAVAAIKVGARKFLPIPPEPGLIAAILETVDNDQGELVFDDPAMREVLSTARQVAPSDASILITGESGTGKELIARYIHRHSRRADKAFVSVNCAAIPENLLESELFGHEKGAFTGATARRTGKFEEASGGTLLLDEISEMDSRLQAKLLRAIQEREIDRVGRSSPVKVDLRVLATSNRNLEAEVAAGRFRADLLFRLNVVNLHLPALRERPGDIAPLARHFATKYAKANGIPDRPLGRAALARLLAHAWTGNVRELENCMHRAVLLAAGDEIDTDSIALRTPTDAEARSAANSGGPSVGRTVAEVERDLILDTLQHTFGNRTHAAKILGISIRTLRNKLHQYSDEGVAVRRRPVASRPRSAPRSREFVCRYHDVLAFPHR
jgi:two-component system response regulator FlrC